MASQVEARTGSPSISRASRAAANGVVASTKAALATVVRVSAVTKVTKAVGEADSHPEARSSPVRRVLRSSPPPRKAMNPAATGITNKER